jgi:lycopene cyclase domain-containing protein
MPVYPALSLVAAAVVVALELRVFRSGIFRQPAYWLSMAIVYAFMIPVDGWLTKLSAPIVIYRDGDTSGLRPVWDILAEEFVYAFSLLTLVILVWDRAGLGEARTGPGSGRAAGEAAPAGGGRDEPVGTSR